MREKILSLLYERTDKYHSGQEISEILGISRTAVWKHIKQLQQQGYEIETAHRKGYRLIARRDLMIPEMIRRNLKTEWLGTALIYMDSIPSTNLWAKTHLDELAHGTVVLAEEQTGGRGRMGRSWDSSKGEGIWMTLVLRPDFPMAEGAKITQLTAAAMHQAITRITGLPVRVKWPNDLLVDHRKVCGILTEMSGELNQMDSLLVGIGVNVNQPAFFGELQQTAASLLQLSGRKINRIDLLTAFLSEFETMYDAFACEGEYRRVLEILRQHSALLGRRIDIIRGNSRISARAVQVHEDGRLEVEYEDGRREHLSGGEVSVRPEQ